MQTLRMNHIAARGLCFSSQNICKEYCLLPADPRFVRRSASHLAILAKWNAGVVTGHVLCSVVLCYVM